MKKGERGREELLLLDCLLKCLSLDVSMFLSPACCLLLFMDTETNRPERGSEFDSQHVSDHQSETDEPIKPSPDDQQKE